MSPNLRVNLMKEDRVDAEIPSHKYASPMQNGAAPAGIVIANLTLNDEVLERMRPKESGIPAWFGYAPTLAGYNFEGKPRPFTTILRGWAQRLPVSLLCFNPSLIYGYLFIAPLPINRIALFQWRPLGRLPPLKRAFLLLTLRRAHVILVYSHIAKRYLQRILPKSRIVQIGLFTDTDYFAPAPQGAEPKSPFLFVPGDHKRDERLLGEVAERLNMRVIRVTRSAVVRDKIRELDHPWVELQYKVSFEDLRKLYRESACVIILSDSSEIPTGITTLAEALACGANIVINQGHGSSWPSDIAADLPFTIIKPKATAADLTQAVVSILEDSATQSERTQKARAFAMRHLSGDALAVQWRTVLSSLPHR